LNYVVDIGCAPGSLSLCLAQENSDVAVLGITNHEPYSGASSLLGAIKRVENFAAIVCDVTLPAHTQVVKNYLSQDNSGRFDGVPLSIQGNKTPQSKALAKAVLDGNFRHPPMVVVSDCCCDQDPASISSARRWEWTNNRLVLSAFSLADSIAGRRTKVILKMLGAKTHVTQSLLYYAACVYDSVVLTKPQYSRSCNDEFYLVCEGRRDDAFLAPLQFAFCRSVDIALKPYRGETGVPVYSYSWAVFWDVPRYDVDWCDNLSTILETLAIRQTLSIGDIIAAARRRSSAPRGREIRELLRPPPRHSGGSASARTTYGNDSTKSFKGKEPKRKQLSLFEQYWTFSPKDLCYTRSISEVDACVSALFHKWAYDHSVCSRHPQYAHKCQCTSVLVDNRRQAEVQSRFLPVRGDGEGLAYAPDWIRGKARALLGHREYARLFPIDEALTPAKVVVEEPPYSSSSSFVASSIKRAVKSKKYGRNH
jgi:23S rRNA U2552 (ribose-2'-O)-methylase RlmE/FtsJ